MTERAERTPRQRAEKSLNHAARATQQGWGAAIAGRRIGWALLDLSDAVREVASAIRESKS